MCHITSPHSPVHPCRCRVLALFVVLLCRLGLHLTLEALFIIHLVVMVWWLFNVIVVMVGVDKASLKEIGKYKLKKNRVRRAYRHPWPSFPIVVVIVRVAVAVVNVAAAVVVVVAVEHGVTYDELPVAVTSDKVCRV